jgi:hypothetical protein
MRPHLVGISIVTALVFCAGSARAGHPKPSPYPIAWELKFDYSIPRRIVVQVPGATTPQAYWYIAYTVTNNTDKEQMFVPIFEMLTKEGTIVRSDRNIPARVFEAIKAQEKRPFMEPYPQIAGEIRLGEDQARDGVAIWPESSTRMGQFSVFVGGLSGEIIALKDSKGEPVKDSEGNAVILRKTLQLNFHIRGDEVFPGEDKVDQNPKEWVMR